MTAPGLDEILPKVATFIEITFHTVGEHGHLEALSTIEAIPGVEILLDHTRPRGFFRRSRLLVDEWDCRIVVWVREKHELLEPDRTTSSERDPYRTLDFGGPVKRVPSALAELLEQLDAKHALVDEGWLRFETRAYEAELLDGLREDIRACGGAYLTARYDTQRGVLAGRISGAIPKIREVQRLLLRSGMVDAEHMLVGYR